MNENDAYGHDIDALLDSDVETLANLLRTREITSVQLVTGALERIHSLNPVYNAFITASETQALRRAADADAELSAGKLRSPLHGIPYALKDNIDTAGILTTSHSKIFADRVPRVSAYLEQRLASSGAVLVGKNSTFEFAIGGPSPDLPWPPARHSQDVRLSPGGSSSGSAVSVSTRMVPLAVGTDTGGSIRWPSSLCGIVGLKPTYGRVSRRGIHPNTYSFDCAGPMAGSVKDAALMLGVIAGHDPLDPSSADEPVPDYTKYLSKGIQGLRVGLVRHWYENAADPDVSAAVDAAVAQLRNLGCIVEEVWLDELRAYDDTKWLISVSELFANHEADLRTRPESFGSGLRTNALAGAIIRAEDYIQAVRWRTDLARRIIGSFACFDVLVTAGWLSTAEPFEGSHHTGRGTMPSITMPFSVAGVPAIVVPCGMSEAGLPISLQIAGRPFAEGTVLRLAYAYETSADWRGHRAPTAQGKATMPDPDRNHRHATDEEIKLLAKSANLRLAPKYMDELVASYRRIEPSLNRLKRNRDRYDEPAHIFDPRRL